MAYITVICMRGQLRQAARLYFPSPVPRAMLEAFIRLLIDNGLLRREPPADDDELLDETALVIHHAAVAGRLGLDHGYEFDRYRNRRDLLDQAERRLRRRGGPREGGL